MCIYLFTSDFFYLSYIFFSLLKPSILLVSNKLIVYYLDLLCIFGHTNALQLPVDYIVIFVTVCALSFYFVFIYLPHDYNNYKKIPPPPPKKKNVGRNGEEA